MLKKSTKKSSKMIDNEKEPELINKISPRRKESFENHSREGSTSSSQKSSSDSIGGAAQGKGGQGGGNSQNRNNLEEIVKILQKPITFSIHYTNKQANGQQKIQGQQQQQIKGTTQQQSNLLNGNGYKLVQMNNANNNGIATNNSYNSQSINESDIPKYIEQSIEIGLKQLESNSLKEAIQQFRNAEVLIDTYMQSEGKVSTDLMLAVVINLGICFYKAGLFDEAYSCFENSDMRMKKKIAEKAAAAAAASQNSKNAKIGDAKYSASAGKSNINNSFNQQINNDPNGISVPNTVGGCISDAAFISSFSKTMKEGVQNSSAGFSSYGIEDALTYFSNLGNKLKRKRLRLSLNLQMCILFSEIGKHEDALDYAKKSSKIAIHILYDCLCICYFVLIRGNLAIANHTLHTEPSNHTTLSNSHTLTEPSSDTCLTLSQKVLLQFEKLNRGQTANNSSQQQAQIQQQLNTSGSNNNNNGTLNNSHRRIRSEYVTPNASNKLNMNFQPNNRNSSSSCDGNNQNASPVVKQRSGSTKGRILTPTNHLEKKLSSSSAYSNTNSNNNISTTSLKQFSSHYSNLLSESIDSPTFTSEDIDQAFKCLPIFHYITNNFGALRDNFNEKIDKKAKLAVYLRSVYEELISSKETDPKKRLSFILSPSQLDMHFINGKVKENHWLLTSNILNLLQMKPVPLSTISSFTPVEKEIQLENTLKKIVESAICFYCISTETRFIEESSFLQNPNLSYKISDSEFWLGKSLEIAYTLIPQDSPMISQIINVYTRFHGVDKQIIPEEEEFPDQVKLLKPQKGVNITSQSISALKNNFFIPAIRTIIPKNHTQNPYIYYHSQPHATENLELYSSDRKHREQEQAEETSDKKQKNFQKDIPYSNISKKVQIPKSIENHIHQHEQQALLQNVNSLQNPNNNSNQQSLVSGDSLQLEGSNTLTPLTQASTQSQTNSAAQSLTIGSQKGQPNNDLQVRQSTQLKENQQQTQQTIQNYLQQKTNETNHSSSSSEGLSYVNQQMQKQQQIQLKQEEQYLNQQKYQQSQFLTENKARSLSREKKPQNSANNQQAQQHQPSTNSSSIKDQQSILEKIEQIVKKQRPQSSSVHSSSSSAAQAAQNNSAILNANNIFGASTNIKKTAYSQHNSNHNTSYNNTSNQVNGILPESSNQICYSEPSNSTGGNNNRIKVASIMNAPNNNGSIVSEQGVSKSQARNIHTSPPQSLQISNQQQNNFVNNSNAMANNNPQQMFLLQQQLLAQAKQKKNNPNNIANNVNTQNIATQQAANQQKQQGHNFLKSFNQFLKQNRLQDDKKQIEPKKPSSGIINQNIPVQNQYVTSQQQQQQQQSNLTPQQQQPQSNNVNQLNIANGPITSEMLAAKKVMKQNFFDNHRPSLPEQFGLANISSQIQQSQSTKSSSNANNIGGINTGSGSIQKSFNYNILKQQQQQLQQQTPSSGQVGFNINKNAHLNNENLMPTRHQSEPHNALKIPDTQPSQSSNVPLGINKQSDNNYHFSVLLNNQIRQNSQEKEQTSQLREKKLNSFKQGDIQINTNFIYLPNGMSTGSNTTTAHANQSDNSLLPQENFLRQLELNNYSLKNQQKRNFSASSKNSSNNTNNVANSNQQTSNQFQQQNSSSSEGQTLVNNFLQTSGNQLTMSQQLLLSQQQQSLQQNTASTAASNQQNQQSSLLSSFASQSGKQPSFMQPTVTPQTATVIQNNIVFQQSTPLEQKTQKVNSRQLHKRKMVSNNIQFNEKFNLVSVKSPSNYPSLQSPSNNFSSIPSTSKSNYAKISMPGSTQLQTKIQFPITNSQIGQSSANQTSQTRKDSAQRKRRIKTDSYDAGAFNSFEIDNKLRNSYERAHSNQQNARLKTQN